MESSGRLGCFGCVWLSSLCLRIAFTSKKKAEKSKIAGLAALVGIALYIKFSNKPRNEVNSYVPYRTLQK